MMESIYDLSQTTRFLCSNLAHDLIKRIIFIKLRKKIKKKKVKSANYEYYKLLTVSLLTISFLQVLLDAFSVSSQVFVLLKAMNFPTLNSYTSEECVFEFLKFKKCNLIV